MAQTAYERYQERKAALAKAKAEAAAKSDTTNGSEQKADKANGSKARKGK